MSVEIDTLRLTAEEAWRLVEARQISGAELFAAELEQGAVVPVEPSRHELFGLGIYVAEALCDGRELSALR